MDQTASFGLVAQTRTKEFLTRFGLGAFIAVGAFVIAPNWWTPVAWLGLMLIGQLLDLRIAARVIAQADNLSRSLERTYIASCALNALLWGMINLHLWLHCGASGRGFSIMVICGGLLHASLKHYPSRTMLIACSLPHALYLFGLPILWTAIAPHPSWPSTAVMVAGGCLYILMLASGSREARVALAALRAANAEAVVARRHAEHASAAKSEFLATVSHEIRTPMNAVLSAAHLLKRTELSPEQAEHVAMLTSAGDVLMSLLNDVLDISKIEAGKMEIEAADAEVVPVLEAIVALWEPQAADKGVTLRLDPAVALPAAIRTDPLRLRQILFNLTSNAVKFTDQGEIVLAAGRAGERLWFEVRDTGCGIDTEAQGRLFTSFEQASVGLTRRHGGTGLGLAISRRLAELMGGSLTLTSVPGEGSTFRLELPLIEAAAPPMVRLDEADTAEPAPPLSILVAEDHPVNRRIVSMFLEPMGWRLTMAENGQEAVQAAQAEAFDVILMDMQMPIMDGIAATRAIRSGRGPNAATPVVALTANAMGHHRDLWVAAGVEAFLTKPIEPQLLVASIIASAGRGGVTPVSASAA